MDYSDLCENAKQDLYLFFRYNVCEVLEWRLLTAERIPYEYGWKAVLEGTSWPGEQVLMWNLGSEERNIGTTKPSYGRRHKYETPQKGFQIQSEKIRESWNIIINKDYGK